LTLQEQADDGADHARRHGAAEDRFEPQGDDLAAPFRDHGRHAADQNTQAGQVGKAAERIVLF